MKDALKLLKQYKYKIPKNTYKTMRGQIIHNDIEGFKKGLNRIIASNSKNKDK